jgi:YggT family protein
MISDVFLAFVDLFVLVFNFLLIVRVIMSYIAKPDSRFFTAIVGLTEPLLVPVRRVLPVTPGIDWAPLAAFFALQGLQYGAHLLLGA